MKWRRRRRKKTAQQTDVQRMANNNTQSTLSHNKFTYDPAQLARERVCIHMMTIDAKKLQFIEQKFKLTVFWAQYNWSVEVPGNVSRSSKPRHISCIYIKKSLISRMFVFSLVFFKLIYVWIKQSTGEMGREWLNAKKNYCCCARDGEEMYIAKTAWKTAPIICTSCQKSIPLIQWL